MVKLLRVLKTALQYMYRNFGLSFASVVVMTLSFFIVSMVGLAFYGSLKVVKDIDARPPLTIFLRGDLTPGQSQEFIDLVKSTNLVRDVKVKDIEYSKEDFAKKFPGLEGTVTDVNKSSISVLAFVYSNSQQNLDQLIQVLGNNENFMNNIVDRKNIDKIPWYQYNKDQAEVIKDANSLLRTSGIAITAFLFIISSILIFITVRLTINYHKRELEIMDLVGADGWFVRSPFIIDGIVYGILGALFSSGIIFIFKNLILQRSKEFVPRLGSFFSGIQWPALEPTLILKVLLATMGVGAFVGAISSFFAIMRYVRK